jgi:hypothetical protein
MAYYLVRSHPDWERLEELAQRLEAGEINEMEPFGRALHHSLTNARRVSDDEVIWEEEDYCRPPLKEERRAVLDEYFSAIEVEEVEKGDGWQQIEDLPTMWPDAGRFSHRLE